MPDVFELPVSGIPAQLKIKGSSQTFEFDDLASVQTIMKNKFVPTLVANTQERLGWYNSNDCGFLFDHITTSTDTRGTFKLRSKVNDTYTDIFSVSNSNVLTFNASVGFDGLNLPRLGIGIDPTVNGRIQFTATSMVNKLSLYNAGSDDYEQSGFGYNSLGTLYHAPAFTSHTFYLGNSTTIPLRANALGITISELRPVNADFRRIMFLDEGENLHQLYNIGLKQISGTNYSIHSQVSKTTSGFTWSAGIDASSSVEMMRLFGNSGLTVNNLIGVNATPNTDVPMITLTNLNVGSSKTKIRMQQGPDSFEAGYDSGTTQSFLNSSANDIALRYFGTTRLKVGSDNLAISYLDSSTTPFALRTNGTNRLYIDNTAGNIGLNTTTPTTGKMVINGGVQNIASEETALRVFGSTNSIKIELLSTAVSGKLYELRSTSTGNFDVTNRTNGVTPYTIDTNNNHVFNTAGTVFGKTSRAYVYMAGNATGAASVANTWVKVPGVTILGPTSNLFDMPANNRVRFTGSYPLTNANIIVCLTFTYASSVSTRLGFSIHKNGTVLAESPKYVTNTTTNLSMFVSLGVSTNFSNTDYIEVFFISPNAGVTLTVTDLSILIL